MLEPLFCEDLLYEIDRLLAELMRGISKDDWNKKTLYPQWRVKDIFSHIIDTSIRKMSVQRDGWFDESRKPGSTEWEPLVRYITGLADEWAGATRRISPRILLSVFDVVREELHIFMKGMDPFAEAVFSVAWAGEESSKVWFDNAREYTEHWLHQQQIREALGAAGLSDEKYLRPLLDTLVRAVPAAYREVRAEEGAAVLIEISGGVRESYVVEYRHGRWDIRRGAGARSDAQIRADALTACRMFMNMAARDEKLVSITGDKALGRHFLDTLSLMA